MVSSALEPSESREKFFSLSSYQYAPTQQLYSQPQVWQSAEDQGHERSLDEDLELSSADEADYTMKVNTEKERINEDTVEDIEEEHLESILEPTTSYGFPLPPDNFKPLKSRNHSRDWKFPLEFGTDPRVCPP